MCEKTGAMPAMRSPLPRPLRLRVLAGLLASLPVCGALAVALTGCGRKVNDADCRKIADHLGEVWTAEAKSDETEGPGKEKAVDVIRQEGEHFTRDWIEGCKRDLVGKRVEEKDLTCLL